MAKLILSLSFYLSGNNSDVIIFSPDFHIISGLRDPNACWTVPLNCVASTTSTSWSFLNPVFLLPVAPHCIYWLYYFIAFWCRSFWDPLFLNFVSKGQLLRLTIAHPKYLSHQFLFWCCHRIRHLLHTAQSHVVVS